MKKNKIKKNNYLINESDTMNKVNGSNGGRLDVFFIYDENTNQILMVDYKTGEIIAKN